MSLLRWFPLRQCPSRAACVPRSPWAALNVPLYCPQASPVIPLRPSRTGHTTGAPGSPSPSGTWSPTAVPRGCPWLGTPPCPAALRTGSAARGAGQRRGAKVQLRGCHTELWLSPAQGTATAAVASAPADGEAAHTTDIYSQQLMSVFKATRRIYNAFLSFSQA